MTQALRELEEDHIVLRTVAASVPPRVDYELSDLGLSLLPVFTELRAWGLKYKEVLSKF